MTVPAKFQVGETVWANINGLIFYGRIHNREPGYYSLNTLAVILPYQTPWYPIRRPLPFNGWIYTVYFHGIQGSGGNWQKIAENRMCKIVENPQKHLASTIPQPDNAALAFGSC